jgi:hypothetical protein
VCELFDVEGPSPVQRRSSASASDLRRQAPRPVLRDSTARTNHPSGALLRTWRPACLHRGLDAPTASGGCPDPGQGARQRNARPSTPKRRTVCREPEHRRRFYFQRSAVSPR